MRTLDRYLARQILPAFALALAVLTFVLAVQPALEKAEDLLSKNVPISTVGFLLLTLLPQALGLTIPMAFLIGTLMALGRMSGDREGVALLACGVSPLRLMRPVLALACVLGLADLYVLTRLIPDANQTFRETTFRLLYQQGATDIKPGVFYEGFPGKVIFVRTIESDGRWAGVMVADTTTPDRPGLTLASTGRLELLSDQRIVNLWLQTATRYQPGADQLSYDRVQDEQLRLPVDPKAVFGDGTFALTRDLAELDIAGLQARAAERVAEGLSPHNEIIRIQQMFSFPVACLVFAVLALPLGLHTRKEGKLAGFTLGLATIFLYYALLAQAEALTKSGDFPALWARWVPNIALGAAGVLAIWWRTRARGHSLSLVVPAWLVALRRRSARPADAPDALPAEGRRPVVVIRVPAFDVPRPRLLDLYVTTRYLRILLLSFVGLLGLYYIGQFIELAEKMFKGNATSSMLLSFLAYSTPQFVAYLLPVATLVAVLSTIGALTRTSELTVMRACGVSLYRVAAPLVLISLLLSGLLFVLEERVLARANRRADELNDLIRGRASRTLNVANRNWLAGADGRIYYFAFFDRGSRSVFALSVYDTAPSPYRLAAHTFVRDAVYRDEAWQAGEAWTQRFADKGLASRSDLSRQPLALAPIEDFERAQVDASLMTFAEQREHVAELRASGYSTARQEVELHQKLAFPLVTLVMTLLAVPFGVTTGRHGALYGIGLVIGLAFGYHFLMTLFTAAGAAGLLPAIMAAWAANVLFLSAAAYLILRVRT